MWVLCSSHRLGHLAIRLGHEVGSLDGAPADGVEAVVLDGPGAWDQVRGWRAAGNRVPVVVVEVGEPPADRARLEPVVLVRQVDAGALQAALAAAGVGRPAGRVRLAAGTADLDRRRFEPSGADAVALSPLECRLLGYMAARSGRAIGREELQLQVWDHRKAVATRAVDMTVMRLRKKIELDREAPTSLLTAAPGYRLLVTPEPSRLAVPLPRQLVGRDGLVVDVIADLRTEGALLLTGPPGVGKTGVCEAVGGVWAETGPVLWADLDGIESPERAAEALAEAAGVDLPRGTEPGDALSAVLGSVDGALWVVDHLDDAPELASVLASLARGPVLIASRQSSTGIAVRVIPTLDAQSAGELLRLRARFSGAEVDDGLVDRLLPLLDGLPLVIELVAANLRALGDDAVGVLERDGLGLTDGAGRSVAAAIERSWMRLPSAARGLLAGLSVVDGPVDLGVARRLALGPVVGPWTALVESSLVTRRGEVWVVLHAVRSFARDALADAAAAGERRHMTWMAAYAARWLPAVDEAGGPEALERLVLRRGDLDRAWETACALREDEALAELTGAVDRIAWRFGTVRGRRERIEAALDVVRAPLPRARLLMRLGMCRSHADRRTAIENYEAAGALAEGVDPDLGARAGMASAQLLLWTDGAEASLARLRGIDLQGCSEVYRVRVQSSELDLLDRIGERGIGEVQAGLLRAVESLAELGDLHSAVWVGQSAASRLGLTGDRDPVAHMQRVTEWSRQVADPRMLSQSLVSLANQLGQVCRTDDALASLDEALAIVVRVEPVRRWQIVSMRGRVLATGGRFDAARVDLEAYQSWCVEVDSPVGAADAGLWLAALEIEAGDFVRAEHHGREAAAAAERGGYASMVWHGAFHRSLALQELGRWEAALAVIRDVDLERLSTPLEQLRAAALDHVAAARVGVAGVDVDLERVAAGIPGPVGRGARELVEASARGDRAALVAWAEPTSGQPLELRLLARTLILLPAPPTPGGLLRSS